MVYKRLALLSIRKHLLQPCSHQILFMYLRYMAPPPPPPYDPYAAYPVSAVPMPAPAPVPAPTNYVPVQVEMNYSTSVVTFVNVCYG